MVSILVHMRALPRGWVADALATVRVSRASVTTKRAFEFLVLAAARSGEVRLATWDEMDLNAGVWTIAAVLHGFRSSFRDWAADRRAHPARWSRPPSPARCRTPPRRPTRAVISSSVGAA